MNSLQLWRWKRVSRIFFHKQPLQMYIDLSNLPQLRVIATYKSHLLVAVILVGIGDRFILSVTHEYFTVAFVIRTSVLFLTNCVAAVTGKTILVCQHKNICTYVHICRSSMLVLDEAKLCITILIFLWYTADWLFSMSLSRFIYCTENIIMAAFRVKPMCLFYITKQNAINAKSITGLSWAKMHYITNSIR